MDLTAADIQELLTEYGVDATFRTYPSSSYSVATGKATQCRT